MRNTITPLGWVCFTLFLILGCAVPWLDYPVWLVVPLCLAGAIFLAAWAAHRICSLDEGLGRIVQGDDIHPAEEDTP